MIRIMMRSRRCSFGSRMIGLWIGLWLRRIMRIFRRFGRGRFVHGRRGLCMEGRGVLMMRGVGGVLDWRWVGVGEGLSFVRCMYWHLPFIRCRTGKVRVHFEAA